MMVVKENTDVDGCAFGQILYFLFSYICIHFFLLLLALPPPRRQFFFLAHTCTSKVFLLLNLSYIKQDD